MKQRW